LDPNDHIVRLQRAQTALFLKDFSGAASILREGVAASGAPGYRRGLGDVYASWSDSIKEQVQGTPEECLRLLEEGLRYDPVHVGLLQRIIALSSQTGEVGEKAARIVERTLAEGQATATIHTLMGMDAHQRGQTEEARQHYETAYSREPNIAIVVNNLAWLLAHADSPDLTRALELINGAVKQWPDQLEFLDTRGHILAKMQRWEEARSDLEAVLTSRPDKADLHLVLAEAYENLGGTEKAAEHRRLAGQNSP
jgi:tetratricopeptide (TPR) repeat protein